MFSVEDLLRDPRKKTLLFFFFDTHNTHTTGFLTVDFFLVHLFPPLIYIYLEIPFLKRLFFSQNFRPFGWFAVEVLFRRSVFFFLVLFSFLFGEF